MKKTSRRTFGKQLTGALAALPLACHLIEVRADNPQKSSDEKIRPQFRSEHNTPPPALFMGGSLVFEVFSDKNDWDDDGDLGANGRRKWSVRPKPYDGGMSPTNIFIAHVKLVDGAGEMEFTLHNAEKEPIEIIATLKKGGVAFGDCRWIAAGDHFEIDVPPSKRLKKKGNDLPHNSRRQRVRYRHESGSNPDRCDWVGLKITQGGVPKYDKQNLPEMLPGYDETLRLMVWWENR